MSRFCCAVTGFCKSSSNPWSRPTIINHEKHNKEKVCCCLENGFPIFADREAGIITDILKTK